MDPSQSAKEKAQNWGIYYSTYASTIEPSGSALLLTFLLSRRCIPEINGYYWNATVKLKRGGKNMSVCSKLNLSNGSIHWNVTGPQTLAS